jgi:hypothetical protein
MTPDAPNQPGPDESAEPAETVNEFLVRVDKEIKQVDEDIQKAEREGEWLKCEPEL